jgi:hypothetical protein
MLITWRDRLTPTAIGLVSRAWVIERVARIDGVDEQTRGEWIEALCAYEPQRETGMRNRIIFWGGAIGAAMLAQAIGLPGWAGFVAALAGFLLLARRLATRTLDWRLDQLRDARGGGA